MEHSAIFTFLEGKAKDFGAKIEGATFPSYVLRNNTGPEALKDQGAFFGFIHPDEEPSGPYHDFSFVLFPPEQADKPWLVSLCVGSLGFKQDYELATRPGLKRMFESLIDADGFCKTSFSDIESPLPKAFLEKDDVQHLKKTLEKYKKVLPACQIIKDPSTEEGKQILAAFLAGYARFRNWPTNQNYRKAVDKALTECNKTKEVQDDLPLVKELLKQRKFVVLQGPPGVGKTRLAKKVSHELEADILFTQFHAETNYTDFIYGIRPNVDVQQLNYEGKEGIFLKALRKAEASEQKKVVLIIDELNRANLANILGPVFYLFEPKMKATGEKIEIAPGKSIEKLPENFYVIATMNTADRSLAVVDFALRRRFAWYTLWPKPIAGSSKKIDDISVVEINDEQCFFSDHFSSMEQIFQWFASSQELNLQPGQGYFIAGGKQEMEQRLRYELLPLIREYLDEGLLLSAKEEFNNYFMKSIGEPLYA